MLSGDHDILTEDHGQCYYGSGFVGCDLFIYLLRS